MIRRTLPVMLGAVVAAAMSCAWAQPAPREARIGILSATNPQRSGEWYAAFKDALRNLGWVENQNTRFFQDHADGNPALLEEKARLIVAQKVDVVFVGTGDVARFFRKVDPRLPVVFALHAGPDLGDRRIVESLARPGGNVTGFSTDNGMLSAKRLQLLKDIVRDIRPGGARIAYLYSDPPDTMVSLGFTGQAAARMGAQFLALRATSAPELGKAFQAFTSWRADVLVVAATQFLNTHPDLVVEHAAQVRLPAIYTNPRFVSVGGLMSYTADFADNYRRAAGYVDRILKGEKPADLPVQLPAKFDLLINATAARTLGLLPLPDSIRAEGPRFVE